MTAVLSFRVEFGKKNLGKLSSYRYCFSYSALLQTIWPDRCALLIYSRRQEDLSKKKKRFKIDVGINRLKILECDFVKKFRLLDQF